jgi:putative transposase
LTTIIDLYDRKVIRWAMGEGISAKETVIASWRMAIKNRPVRDKLIYHSDRGVQYACEDFSNILKQASVKQRMSRKGNYWEDVIAYKVAESFFKSLKKECVYRNKYKTKNEAKLSVFQWIETWYNTNRRHSSLG